jgi:hypothetical protein
MEKAYSPIQKITKNLKKEFMIVYASYALSLFCQKVLPRFIPRWFLDEASNKFSIGFSNVPGPIKPLYYLDFEGNKIKSIWSESWLIVAGRFGLAVSC